MVHLVRKGWPWVWWGLFTNLNILFFVVKKTQGKWQEHRENTGNLVLIGAWQPCTILKGRKANFPRLFQSCDNIIFTLAAA